MKALVIDDQEDVRVVVCALLERLGHEATSARDGVEGLAAFQAGRPDIVLTDMLMPQAEGLETIREIRKLGRPVTIVAMSGMQSPTFDLLKCAAQLGADHVLAKPFGLRELRALLECIAAGPAAPATAPH